LDSFIRTYRFDNSIINDSKLNIFDEKFIRCYRNVASDILDMLILFTHQECTSCGFLHKDNRKTQAQFKCLNCGKKLNADVSSARTIKKRFFNNTDSTVTKNNSLKPNKQLYYVSLMNIFKQRNIDNQGSRRCALGHDENQSLNDLNSNG
jgi:predicted RNA-binding Zn-ribbon protein involved in translation (DUF1610 family)